MLTVTIWPTIVAKPPSTATVWRRWIIGFVVLMIATGAIEAAEPTSIEAFTIKDRPIDTGAGSGDLFVTVYELDGFERLEATLSRGLPPDAETAARVAQARIGRLNDTPVQRLQHTAQGWILARRYQLDRYPAIVFDRQAMVFGVTNLNTALQHYRRWQAQR